MRELSWELLLCWANFTRLQDIDSLVWNDGRLQRRHVIGPGELSLVDERASGHVDDSASRLRLGSWRPWCEFVHHCTNTFGTPSVPCTFHLLTCGNEGARSVPLWGGPGLGVVAVKNVVVISRGELQCNNLLGQWTESIPECESSHLDMHAAEDRPGNNHFNACWQQPSPIL